MSDTLEKKLSASKVITKKARSGDVSPHVSREALKEDAAAAATAEREDDSTQNETNSSEFDAEYDVPHPTNETIRDKIRSLLTDALFKKDEDFVKDRNDAQIVANAIEAALYDKLDGNGAPYKNKYRNISFNIKDPKNAKLRMALLYRHIPPSELLNMSNHDLANDELRKNREEVHAKMTRDAMPFSKQEASTDMFKCGKCKQRKCNYYQMQTRSADEPLTTFVSCVHCGNRWRF